MCRASGVATGTGSALGSESVFGTAAGLDNRDRIVWYGLKGSGGSPAGGDDRI